MTTNDIKHWDHDRLLRELRDALEEAHPVPASVDEFAMSVQDLVRIDAHVAELIFDSLVDEVAGTRSVVPNREMTFSAPGVQMEVTVMAEGVRHLVGQLVPPQPAAIELFYHDERRETEADGLGRFTFEDVPSGPLSLRCTLNDEYSTVVQTQWVVL